MKKEIFFGYLCGQNYSIAVADDKIIELDFESESNKNLVGTIYKGRVVNVLPGMQAAFVNCGLKRNCYLSTAESRTEYSAYESVPLSADCKKDCDGQCHTHAPAPLDLKEGDEVLVQVVKPPRGSKGAKVTTRLSYVGKSIIYLSDDCFMGISRKIADDELRENLLFTMNSLKAEGEGMIIRTAAPRSDKKNLKRELDFLRNIDKEVRKKFLSASVGEVLYTDEDLFHRTVRDLYSDEVSAIYVDTEESYNELKSILSLYSKNAERKLVHYKGAEDMLSKFHLIEQITELFRSEVALKSGGYLVIDKTEAMTVIDVNTGKYTGDENLEETVFKTNIEAAVEIARQARLRNLGGIITVDFIDMLSEEHKQLVTAELDKALANDKTKCRLLPMNDFCVSQFIRKRINHDIIGLEMTPCPNCNRRGYVMSASFVAMRISVAISECIASGYVGCIVELNDGVLHGIFENRWFTPLLKSKWKDKQIYLIPNKSYNVEYFTCRGDNSGVLHLPDNARLLY